MMMKISVETPSQEDVDLNQLRQMLDEARGEVDRITEASQSLRDMVDLMSVMFDEMKQRGPVDEEDTSLGREIHRVDTYKSFLDE